MDAPGYLEAAEANRNNQQLMNIVAEIKCRSLFGLSDRINTSHKNMFENTQGPQDKIGRYAH